MSTARTFPELLEQRLRQDPTQPLVTAYDDETGERTELSVTTYANWVSKTANLLCDELGLDPGDTVRLDLPAHWLVPVFLGAAWSAGLAVTCDPDVDHVATVCGPTSVGDAALRGEVIACSLLPFAVRFPEPLPPAVHDYGLLWPGQSDVFVAVVPPTPDTVAWVASGPDEEARRHSDLLESAALGDVSAGVRLLTDVHPASEHGVPAFLGPLVHDGSLVLVRPPSDTDWTARREAERATAVLRAADQPASR